MIRSTTAIPLLSLAFAAGVARAQPALPPGQAQQPPAPAAVAAPTDPPPGPAPPPAPVVTAQVAGAPAPPPTVVVPPPQPPPDPCPPPSRKNEQGARMTGGVAYTQTVTLGAYGRLELEEYMVSDSFVMGLLLGMEGWGSEDGGGGGLPFVWYMGFQEHRSLFATLGFGWDWAIYDRVYRNSGFGIFAPQAAANVGLDFEGVRILADGRAQYRWEWGAPDRFQLKAGLTISVTTDH